MFVFGLLLLSAVAIGANEDGQGSLFCDGLSCASRKELLDLISKYQAERRVHGIDRAPESHVTHAAKFQAVIGQEDEASPAPDTCDICHSQPCLNGGTCHLSSASSPFGSYYCECPDNFGGQYCEKNITCTSKSCGINAVCYVANHQTNCVCQKGYSSSNPQRGCQSRSVQACADGDPHYTTFDGLHFDYQGTCPYVFSQPCTNLSDGYAYYRVVAKNDLPSNSDHVSYVSEVEVTMYSQVVHLVGKSKAVYVNGYLTHVPFYWPSKSFAKVSVVYASNTFTVSNDQLVIVTYNTNGRLCVQVPDINTFNGNNTLCGIAGNRNNWINDDVISPNGTVFPVISSHEPTTRDKVTFNRAEDQWITNNFMTVVSNPNQCLTGEELSNTTNCDSQTAANQCKPIQLAILGQGPFARCQGMGNDTIQAMYDDCIYDLCNMPNMKCNIMQNFARTCMGQVPGTNLGPYGADPTIGCTYACPQNAYYTSCVSACPATCADPYLFTNCSSACSDGCQCAPGYVLDTTNLATFSCIPVQHCGCLDGNGNMHPADQPWLTNNCQFSNVCRNGTFYSKPNSCSQYGHCGEDANHNMACVCNSGFRGDGYNCTDINECIEDPHSCSQDLGYGNCTNTIGSYNCTCKEYYVGRDCELYGPQRHCADLYQYYGQRTNGLYTIAPPYAVNGNPPFSNISVFCDMMTDGGGWTLMSHDDQTKWMANKTYSQYVAGFGDVANQNLWLGLDLINQITADMDTSLRVHLRQCGINGFPNSDSDCTYPIFQVADGSTQYVVTIPQICVGTGAVGNGYDGWVDWDLSGPGPAFVAFDNDHSSSNCSSIAQNTGFWFDSQELCGAANLNGIRFTCDNIPTFSSSSPRYLLWNYRPLFDTWLWLRPKAYPSYDHN